MQTFDILFTLAETSSRLEKEKLLTSYKNDNTLKEAFRLAYNPHINFFIRKIPVYSYRSSTITLDEAMIILMEKIANREVTGNAARDMVADILSNMDPNDASILENIIRKDLRCGVSEKTINKIWKGLIPEMKVMLADTDITRIQFPAIAQPKLDGLRAHITLQDGYCTIQSRNGKVIDDLGFFYEYAREVMKIGETWDGEIVCVREDSPNSFETRQLSNGILNKAIRGTITRKEAIRMRFNTWDIITIKAPYKERLDIIRERFSCLGDTSTQVFYPIYGDIVHSQEEVMSLYSEAVARGEEGLVVKNMNSFWKGSRSKDLCKIKEILDCDLKIVGWEEGTGRNEGRLGNLIGETSDGLLRVGVGTGFSDSQRDNIGKDVIGKIMAVQYNQVIRDKKSEKYSLFLPRFIEVRDDKDSADSIKSILN